MADSGAVRARRARRHAGGDHSLCDPARCRVARAEANGHDDGEVPDMAAPLVPVVEVFLAELRLPKGDAQLVTAQCARVLAARIDKGGAPVIAVRELRSCIENLSASAGRPSDTVDTVRAHRHARRVQAMIDGKFSGW